MRTEQPRRPFAHLIDVLRAANKNRDAVDRDQDEQESGESDDDSDDVEHKPKKSRKKAKPDDIKEHEGDETRDHDIASGDEEEEEGEPRGSLTPAQVTAVAQRIIECGRMRRGEVEVPHRPFAAPKPVHATAEQILAAGRKRRGELP